MTLKLQTDGCKVSERGIIIVLGGVCGDVNEEIALIDHMCCVLAKDINTRTLLLMTKLTFFSPHILPSQTLYFIGGNHAGHKLQKSENEIWRKSV